MMTNAPFQRSTVRRPFYAVIHYNQAIVYMFILITIFPVESMKKYMTEQKLFSKTGIFSDYKKIMGKQATTFET